ncbi:hypothetical protein CLU79DRAFT_845051 [Phycomyces nitens]|nr:hypothetical protein CLU79DRAFT_845051 [Phycomyces nitens]
MLGFRKRLSERIKQNKWTRWFLLLVGIQLFITVPNLIATAVMYSGKGFEYYDGRSDYSAGYGDTYIKQGRIIYESIWFIIFEIWRFWLAIDGVLHSNSLTVSVTFFSTTFAIALGVMQIIECKKVFEFAHLSVAPQIVLTSLLGILAPPTFYATYRMYQQSDWIKYNKLGPDVSIHHMYHWVQCFVLALKGNIFFQAMTLCLYFTLLPFSYNWVYGFMIGFAPIATIGTLYFGRKGIAYENHVMMITFIISETLYLATHIIFLIKGRPNGGSSYWYFLYAYGILSIIMCLITIMISIKCQTQFGKGLRNYVQMGRTKNKVFAEDQAANDKLENQYILDEWNDVTASQEPEPPGAGHSSLEIIIDYHILVS